MIRPGEEKDIPQIVDMSREFWKQTQFKEVEFETDMAQSMSEMCIDKGMMLVLELEKIVHGFACGLTGPLLANSSVLVGTELAWWVDPDYRSERNGIDLMLALESAAKKQGVRFWNMVYMESAMPKKVESIYRRIGDSLGETTYTKELE